MAVVMLLQGDRRRHAVRRRSGSTKVEYVLLILCVCAMLLLCLLGSTSSLEGTFHLVSRNLDTTPAAHVLLAEPRSNPPLPPSSPENDNALAYLLPPVLLTLGVASIGLRGIWRRRHATITYSHASPQDSTPHPTEPDPCWARLAAKRRQILNTLIDCGHPHLPGDLTVAEVMTREVFSASPLQTAAELRDVFAEKRFRHILICDEDGTLVGVVSDRDLARATDQALASQIMTQCPTTIGSNSLVNHAISVLLYGRISSLPVIDEGKLVGILTTTDVVMALQCTMLAVEQIVRDLRLDIDHEHLSQRTS